MKKSVARKFNSDTAAFDWNRAMQAKTFDEFDDAVTAPLHGFKDKNDYYDRCSSTHFLARIETETLIINALDDPFMSPKVVPDATALSDSVRIELAEHGGHVVSSPVARRCARSTTCPAESFRSWTAQIVHKWQSWPFFETNDNPSAPERTGKRKP